MRQLEHCQIYACGIETLGVTYGLPSLPRTTPRAGDPFSAGSNDEFSLSFWDAFASFLVCCEKNLSMDGREAVLCSQSRPAGGEL